MPKTNPESHGPRRRPRRVNPAAQAVIAAAAMIHGAFSSAGADHNFVLLGSTGSGQCSYPALAYVVVARYDALGARRAEDPAEPQPAATMLPMSQQWMTPALIAETQDVWSRRAGRRLTEEDAVEILGNVKLYVEVMLRAEDLLNANHEKSA